MINQQLVNAHVCTECSNLVSLQVKGPLSQCSTRVLTVLPDTGNAPVDFELPRAIRETADLAVQVVHSEAIGYAGMSRFELDGAIDSGVSALDLYGASFTAKYKLAYDVVMPAF